jgi:hypothetical protein
VSAPHPPYSPDLAPSNCSLFGEVKHLVKGKKFASVDEFLREISHIGRDELDAVFANWEMGLQKCVNMQGQHVD